MIDYLLVFLGGAIPWLEIALVIPFGIITGLNPAIVILVGFLGNMLTLLALIIGFEKVKEWWSGKDGDKNSKRQQRARVMWNKYGLPGMIMLGPIFIGSHIAAFIGMTLGATRSATILWSVISVGGWSLAIGILTALGFDFFT
ncbi:small multi-drug export protein [Saliterribacillus persicus]|uniref:Putative small multi-drug export protein n=1 Tax=Saliterribacillus persicus TaxID=930114 RepID=A0A368Y5B2_9BACI|nr:small multi-drug export protein [Saliterribacillus persicus]RCW74939.1 putative small multi-drug export protein [Saliterribacillus persicus]